MGQISEDMNDGTCCSLCGCYFENPKDENATYTHGYPVVCWNCWHGLTNTEKTVWQKSDVETI